MNGPYSRATIEGVIRVYSSVPAALSRLGLNTYIRSLYHGDGLGYWRGFRDCAFDVHVLIARKDLPKDKREVFRGSTITPPVLPQYTSREDLPK